MASATLAVAAMVSSGFGLSPNVDRAAKAEPTQSAPAPIVAVRAKSTTVSQGEYLDVTATAKTNGGPPIGGRQLNLQRKDGRAWVTVGSAKLSAGGVSKFRFRVWKAHSFRATVAGAAGAAPAASTPVPVKTRFDDLAFGKAVVADAAKHNGAPYVFATDGPRTFDCSGLVKYVFAKYHISLPHHADDMKHYGREIPRSQARQGDLVFAFHGSFAHHVAIYAGNGTWWEAPHTGAHVQHVKLRGAHLEFRRVVPSNHAITW